MSDTEKNAIGLSPSWMDKTLAQMIDYRAHVAPVSPFAEYPVSPISYDNGFRKFTYAQLANAINGVAFWLRKSLGSPPATIETLAFIGTSDIRVPALLIGASKAGYALYLGNARMSINNDFMSHTSGSTVTLKVPTVTHGVAKGTIEMMGMESPEGFRNQCELWREERVFAVSPPFTASFLGLFFCSVAFGMVTIVPLSAAIPTADGIVKARKQVPFDTAFVHPSVIRELSQSSELLDYTSKHLKRLSFIGGDLPQDVGDVVSSKIPLLNHYGSTESSLLTLLLPTGTSSMKRDWRDWKYL